MLFDPGPRVWSMREGERKEALEGMLSVADVVLVTEEEGQVRTGKGAWRKKGYGGARNHGGELILRRILCARIIIL